MFVTDIDGVNALNVFGIIVFEHGDKSPLRNIPFDMECAKPGKPDSVQRELAHDDTAIGMNVSADGPRIGLAAGGIAERPFVEATAEVEAQAVMVVEVLRLLRHAV